MIRPIKIEDESFLMNRICNNRFQNIYLYIDVLTYGFTNKDISTYIAGCEESIDVIIYIYHNSIQLFQVNINEATAKEVADFIISRKIKRISGSKEIIDLVSSYIQIKSIKTEGWIMRYAKQSGEMSGRSCFAKIDDFHQIAELIYSDPHLGCGYEYSDLYNQLVSRFRYDNCENIYISVDGKIVSHFATYAIAGDFAVLSGMVTAPEYRGKGYGSILLNDLSLHIMMKGYTPILICYQEEYYTWYQQRGYIDTGTSAKIDIKY